MRELRFFAGRFCARRVLLYARILHWKLSAIARLSAALEGALPVAAPAPEPPQPLQPPQPRGGLLVVEDSDDEDEDEDEEGPVAPGSARKRPRMRTPPRPTTSLRGSREPPHSPAGLRAEIGAAPHAPTVAAVRAAFATPGWRSVVTRLAAE